MTEPLETKIPSNHVVGVIHDSKKVEAAANEAREAGYDDLLVLSSVKSAGEGAQSLTALVERLGGHLRDQPAYMDQYRELTERGAVIVAVRVGDPDEADETRQLLERHGATNLRFFGRFAVADMAPATNPAAPGSA